MLWKKDAYNKEKQQEELQDENQKEHVVTDEQYELLRKDISVYGLRVNLMTDDQIELLKKQTSLYETISHQLHKQFSDYQDFNGMMIRNLYSEPPTPTGYKILQARRRWTPRPLQLQYLESVYERCNGTVRKREIKDLSAQLVQHGPITEANVYNWFQNRRARAKRMQSIYAENKEGSVKGDECSKEVNNAKLDDDLPDSPLIAEQIFFQVPHEGIDELIGKMEAPPSFFSSFSMQ